MATKQTLLDLIDRLTPDVRKAFLASIKDIKDNARIGQIEAAIRAGNIDTAVNAIGIDSAALRPLSAAIERSYETGGIFTASQFQRPVGQAAFRFDVRNSRAEAWLRDYSSKAVTRITNEQLGLIRDVLNRGINAGINPRDMALDLIGRVGPNGRTGGIIGLNGPQERYLANAKRELAELDPNYFSRELRDKRFDSTVRKAIDSGTPLTQEQIDQLSTRYSDNLLQWRGETIARDQTLTALNQSQNEAARQLVESGAVDQQDITREWDSAGDNRVRETHRDMNGQKVRMDEAFTTPDGNRLMYPGDSSLGAPPEETINCRCVVKLRVDYIRKARLAAG
jgi:hypothetical protein